MGQEEECPVCEDYIAYHSWTKEEKRGVSTKKR